MVKFLIWSWIKSKILSMKCSTTQMFRSDFISNLIDRFFFLQGKITSSKSDATLNSDQYHI